MRGIDDAASLLLLFSFTLVSVLPENALAFEKNSINASPDEQAALVLALKRDPYLYQAIARVPEYDYGQTSAASRATAPITIAGAWPTRSVGLVFEGEASYYSRAGCLGCNALRVMANGQPLNDTALTMAIGADKKHLVGHVARVTNLLNGKSVKVNITDTGGFYQEKYGRRVADLTVAAKQALGIPGGKGHVRVEVF